MGSSPTVNMAVNWQPEWYVRRAGAHAGESGFSGDQSSPGSEVAMLGPPLPKPLG